MENLGIIIPFVHADRTPMSKRDRKERTEKLDERLCTLTDRVKTCDMERVPLCVRPSLELFKHWSRDWDAPFYAGKPFYNGWTEIMNRMWQDLAMDVAQEDYMRMEPNTIEKLLIDVTIEYATLYEERENRLEQKKVNRRTCLNRFFMIGLSLIFAINVYGFYTR